MEDSFISLYTHSIIMHPSGIIGLDNIDIGGSTVAFHEVHGTVVHSLVFSNTGSVYQGHAAL